MNASPNTADIRTAASPFVTRPPRILLDESQCARVRLWRDGEAEGNEFPAEMIDISSGGTKLRVTTCLRFEESVRLRIEIPSVDLNCYVLASVRHIRPAGEGRWIVGCSVRPPLDEQAVARLVMQTGCDRRRWLREPVSLDVSINRQLGLLESEGKLIDLSAGGFCIQLCEPCTAGERIRVGIRDASGRESVVMAGAQWQLKMPEGFFLVGCKFLRAEDYHVVRGAAGEPVVKESEPAEAPPPQSLWPAAALLACAPIAMVVLLETNWAPPAAAVMPPAAHEEVLSRPAPTNDNGAGETDLDHAPPGEVPPPAARRDVTGDGHQTPDSSSSFTGERELREWTDSTGQFRVMAALIAIDDNRVHLRRADGREVFVPLAQLSAADVEYVQGSGGEVSK